mmetsp:Transcript_19336/g.27177  ORF Transcript_19336/g.27177 Transcript_19336/m.27177 type:complete len:131 (-) Transcript_19336:11-403(-)
MNHFTERIIPVTDPMILHSQNKNKQPKFTGIIIRVLYIATFSLLNIINAAVKRLKPLEFVITTTTNIDGSEEIGLNSDLSYPIYLNGQKCFINDLEECGNNSIPMCCSELSNPNSSGPQKVKSKLFFKYL